MIRIKRQRMDYQQQFEKLIGAHNSGSANIEQIYSELIKLVKTLNREEQRHVSEDLSEEELTVFDLLVNKPEVTLSETERQAVKKATHDLLEKLKDGLLAIDWRKHQRSQAQEAVTDELFEDKVQLVYQHVYENYCGEGQSTYSGLPLGV